MISNKKVLKIKPNNNLTTTQENSSPLTTQGAIMNHLTTHALRLAEQGFAVVPLHTPQSGGTCSCGGSECSRQGKHPRIRDWRTKATSEPDTIRGWWKSFPDANIGIVPDKSGLICLDADDEATFDEIHTFLLDNEVRTLIAALVVVDTSTSSLTIH